jgi:hypothetical protein
MDPEYKGFYLVPPLFGILPAPWRLSTGRFWGRLHTVEYLIRLAAIWAPNPYDQIEEHGNFAPILLGDMAPEGGEKNRWDKCEDHKSHRSGVDFDIYLVRKDGMPAKTNISDTMFYDYERSLELARAIYAAGPSTALGVGMVFFDDRTMNAKLGGEGIGPPGPDPGRSATATSPPLPPTPHRDHFHVRLRQFVPPPIAKLSLMKASAK